MLRRITPSSAMVVLITKPVLIGSSRHKVSFLPYFCRLPTKQQRQVVFQNQKRPLREEKEWPIRDLAKLFSNSEMKKKMKKWNILFLRTTRILKTKKGPEGALKPGPEPGRLLVTNELLHRSQLIQLILMVIAGCL